MDRLSARSLVIPVLILGVTACSKNTNRNEFPVDTARGAVAPTVTPTTTDTSARRDTSAVRDTMVRRDTSVMPTTPTPSPTPGGHVTLQVSGGPDGYLTDDKGRAVYFIASPGGTAADCTGDCMTNFEPVTGMAMVATGDSTVKSAMIGSVARPDGSQQVTYAGKPLFYHRGDTAAGDTKGQGMKAGSGEASLVAASGGKAIKP